MCRSKGNFAIDERKSKYRNKNKNNSTEISKENKQTSKHRIKQTQQSQQCMCVFVFCRPSYCAEETKSFSQWKEMKLNEINNKIVCACACVCVSVYESMNMRIFSPPSHLKTFHFTPLTAAAEEERSETYLAPTPLSARSSVSSSSSAAAAAAASASAYSSSSSVPPPVPKSPRPSMSFPPLVTESLSHCKGLIFFFVCLFEKNW